MKLTVEGFIFLFVISKKITAVLDRIEHCIIYWCYTSVCTHVCTHIYKTECVRETYIKILHYMEVDFTG